VRTVFLDTVGLIALWDESDQWHADASAAYARLRLKPTRLVTTSSVLYECGNAAARRPYRGEVAKFRKLMERSGNLIHPTVEQLEHAWTEYEDRQPGSAGVVDLISFAVMTELGIQEALSNDVHFRTEGFTTLF
jgi:predicted nucleic acid-binding protein